MMLQQAHHLRYSMLTTYRDYPSSRSSSIWFHRRGPWSAGCSHSRFQVGASLDPAPESLALTFFGVVGAPAQSDVVLRCAALHCCLQSATGWGFLVSCKWEAPCSWRHHVFKGYLASPFCRSKYCRISSPHTHPSSIDDTLLLLVLVVVAVIPH